MTDQPMKYLYSLIDFCECGDACHPEQKDHDHSKCSLIRRHYDPECKLNLKKMKEFRYYASSPLYYKQLSIHCTVCDSYTSPWFPPEYRPGILYMCTEKERKELSRLRM